MTTAVKQQSGAPDSAKRWRVAIIGAGTITQLGHIPRFQSIANVEVVALVDVNEGRAMTVASETHIPHVYADYQQMLKEQQPDIVVVATPNIFHKQMAMDALNAGAHVLCEKPMALTSSDAREMIRTAEAVNRLLTVGTHYRWSDPVRAAKAHVDGGFFGEIYAVRTVWHRQSGIPGYGSWFTRKSLSGGGALLDIGIHALDRALYLLGYPEPVTVSGASFSKFGPRGIGLSTWGVERHQPDANVSFDVDDLSWAFVRFDNGTVLQFQVSWAAHMENQFQVEIFGTEGGARVGDKEGIDLFTHLNGQPVHISPDIPRTQDSSYGRLIDEFVAYLDGDESARVITPRESLIAVRIIEGIMQSAESGREVEL